MNIQSKIDSLLNSDGPNCHYCNVRMTRSKPDLEGRPIKGKLTDVTLDHVLAIKHGGTNALGNLVLSCRWCNSTKGDTLVEDWLISLPLRWKIKLVERQNSGSLNRPGMCNSSISEFHRCTLRPNHFHSNHMEIFEGVILKRSKNSAVNRAIMRTHGQDTASNYDG